MANLKRNMIELVKEVKGEEVITETYWTPPFIPMSVLYEAIDLYEKNQNRDFSEKELIDLFVDFIANRVYGKQFTKEDLMNGIHAPNMREVLDEQIMFVAQGQQSSETKNFLAKKK